MKIKVYSRQVIERLASPERPHIIISVHSTTDVPADVPEGSACLGVLRLAFDDLRRPMPDFPQLREFTDEQARQVWAFVDKHSGAEECLIHCDKGRSRSPGIAAAVSRAVNGSDGEFFRRYNPNPIVYRTLNANR